MFNKCVQLIKLLNSQLEIGSQVVARKRFFVCIKRGLTWDGKNSEKGKNNIEKFLLFSKTYARVFANEFVFVKSLQLQMEKLINDDWVVNKHSNHKHEMV